MMTDCIVLYCIVLIDCIKLYCSALYCIVLHCIVLTCITLYCIVQELVNKQSLDISFAAVLAGSNSMMTENATIFNSVITNNGDGYVIFCVRVFQGKEFLYPTHPPQNPFKKTR